MSEKSGPEADVRALILELISVLQKLAEQNKKTWSESQLGDIYQTHIATISKHQITKIFRLGSFATWTRLFGFPEDCRHHYFTTGKGSIEPRHIECIRRILHALRLYSYASGFAGLPASWLPFLENALVAVKEALNPGRATKNKTSRIAEILIQMPLVFRPCFTDLFKNYLGAPDGVIPFGGRKTELEDLDKWLDSETKQLLVIAPMARGKTALLMRWIDSVPTSWQVVFVPVSKSLRTNDATTFYEVLAHELASVLGIAEGPTVGEASEHFRRRCLDLMQEVRTQAIRLILVVDGFDELTSGEIDRSLLKADPSSPFRVVVSARIVADDQIGRSWINRLDWREHGANQCCCIELGPLLKEGVVEALRSMNGTAAELADREDVLDSLMRLTSGDPLLVHTYAISLAAQPDEAEFIDPKELKLLEPEYGGFFKKWFEDQADRWMTLADRAALDTIFGILTVAIGPLKGRELEELCCQCLEQRNFILNRTLIKSIERFILGDGKDLGYTLQHPRLTHYFREEYFAESNFLSKAETILTNWCAKVIAKNDRAKLTMEEIPAYVLNYAHHHMMNAFNIEIVELLLHEPWQLAVMNRSAGEGYVRYSDVIEWLLHQIGEKYELPPANRVEIQLKCVLILSSILSLANASPWEILIALVKKGEMSPTDAFYRLHLRKSDQLRDSLPHLYTFSDSCTKKKIIELAEAIPDASYRAQTLALLADHMADEVPRKSVIERAFNALNETIILDEGFRSRIIDQRKSYRSAFVVLANKLPNYLYERLLVAADKLGHYEQLIKGRGYGLLEDEINEIYRMAVNLTELSKWLPDAYLDRLLKSIEAIPGTDIYFLREAKDEALAAVALRFPPVQGVSIIGMIKSDDIKEKALLQLVDVLPQRTLEEILSDEEPSGFPTIVLLAAAIHRFKQPRRQILFEQAMNLIEEIEDENDQACFYADLAEVVPREFLPQLLKAVEALVVKDPYDEWDTEVEDKHIALAKIASRLPSDQVFSAMEKLSIESEKAEVGFALARSLPATSLDRLLKASATFCDQTKACLLTEMAVRFDGPRRAELLELAFEVTEMIKDDREKKSALVFMAESLAPKPLKRALKASQVIEDGVEVVESIITLAKRLTKPQQLIAFKSAIEIADLIQDDEIRASLMDDLTTLIVSTRMSPAQPAGVRSSIDDVEAQEDTEDVDTDLIIKNWGRRLRPNATFKQVVLSAWKAAGRHELSAATTLVYFSEKVAASVRRDIFESALSIFERWPDVEGMEQLVTELGRRLPVEFLDRLIKITLAIPSKSCRRDMITALLKAMPISFLEQMAHELERVEDKADSAYFLVRLSCRQSMIKQYATLRLALVAGDMIHNLHERETFVKDIIKHLPSKVSESEHFHLLSKITLFLPRLGRPSVLGLLPKLISANLSQATAMSAYAIDSIEDASRRWR